MKISAIVAMGTNRVIGKDNALMWSIPSETRHYKDRLDDHLFIIGRKNYEGSIASIDHSKSLVLTTNRDYRAKAKSFIDIRDAIQFASNSGESELFILGGQQIYEICLPWLNYLYLTIVDFQEEGHTYFPKHEHFSWTIMEESFHSQDQETPYSWHFQKLAKKPDLSL